MTARRARLLVFVLLLAFQFGGPFYRQVLHGRNPLFKNWVMFRGAGMGLVEVEFHRHDAGHADVPIDRFATLGYDDPRAAPDDLFRIVGADGFARAAAQLCARLGPGVDLRAHAREATERGWRSLATGHVNLCVERAPEVS